MIDLPDSIDVRIYDALSGKVALLADRNSDADRSRADNVYPAFGSAWLGVGYRIAAVVRYDAEFRASIAKNPGPAGEERFIQERALFGCATSAVSCVECFFMASYLVGAALRSKSFPVETADHLDKLYPRNIVKAFLEDFASDAFTQSLDEIANSIEFWPVRNMREVLSHRGALLRSHFIPLGTGAPYAAVARNPKALPTSFRYDATLKDETTRIHVQWTLNTLNRLLGELDGFVDRNKGEALAN